MSERSREMLCKALELAENAVEFYEKTLASCSKGLAMDVFAMLRKDAEAGRESVQAIHDEIAGGAAWSAACSLPDEDVRDLKAVLGEMARAHGGESCPASEKDALGQAMAMEDHIRSFYQESLAAAEDGVEKAFLERMVRESHSHYLLLADTQYYYEDPEGWSLKAGKAGLDGA